MCHPQSRLGANTSSRPIYWAPIQLRQTSTRHYGALLGDAPRSLPRHPPAAGRQTQAQVSIPAVAHWSSDLRQPTHLPYGTSSFRGQPLAAVFRPATENPISGEIRPYWRD